MEHYVIYSGTAHGVRPPSSREYLTTTTTVKESLRRYVIQCFFLTLSVNHSYQPCARAIYTEQCY
jgi:hypothetical protein